MALKIWQVDAFASRPLEGNPAAIVPLESWLADDVMQAIAAENNLSETAFLVPSDRADADYDLRWFTPATEVELCGHATLASAHALITGERIRFIPGLTLSMHWVNRPTYQQLMNFGN